MLVKPLLKTVKTKTFLHDYLLSVGIENPEKYLEGGEYNSCHLNNIEKAAKIIKQEVSLQEGKIFVLIDSDADGQLSAAMFVNFLWYLDYPLERIVYYEHTGKQHGLRTDENLVEKIISSKSTICVIPDAGTNDVEQAKLLQEKGIEVIVLDHHPIENQNPYATVVNVHNEYSNPHLSGTGVVHKFVQFYCERYYYLVPEYKDLVMVSLISDICDLRNMENRAYVKDGLKVIEDGTGNPFIKKMVSTFNRKGNTPIGMSFGLIPPINSICRADNIENKYLLFECLSGISEEYSEGIKAARTTHRFQVKTTTEIAEKVESELDLTNKTIVQFVDSNYKNYIGLAANKICGAYNKATVLLRKKKDGSFYSGSIRSPFDIASEINETGLAYCQGHERACGIEIKEENIESFKKWLNGLTNTETEELIAAEISPSTITKKLCILCLNNKDLWGASFNSGLGEPKFRVKATVTNNDVLICGKSKNCARINIDNVYFWKFRCSDKELEKLTSYDVLELDMIVSLSLNEWQDKISPQPIIDKWEISNVASTWEDDF